RQGAARQGPARHLASGHRRSLTFTTPSHQRHTQATSRGGQPPINLCVARLMPYSSSGVMASFVIEPRSGRQRMHLADAAPSSSEPRRPPPPSGARRAGDFRNLGTKTPDPPENRRPPGCRVSTRGLWRNRPAYRSFHLVISALEAEPTTTEQVTH